MKNLLGGMGTHAQANTERRMPGTFSSASMAACIVEPVVMTSSTIITWRPASPSSVSRRKMPCTLSWRCARKKCVCDSW